MKTIVFDFDGTLTKKSNEIWTKMWEALDALDVDYEIYCKYRDKEIDYVKWCELIEIEYKKRGFNKDLLNKLSSNIELMDNLEETLKTLKDNGYALYIISGGVDYVIESKLNNLTKYFDGIYSCGFRFDESGLLTNIIPTRYDDEGKKLFIDEYCEKTGTNPKEITFIGNGDNDEYVYLSGCHTICINPLKKTKYEDNTIWHKVIKETKDMRSILPYLNIRSR
jgi:phosphoserine phosphatase